VKNKIRFLFPVTILVFVYFMTTISLILDKYEERKELNNLKDSVVFAIDISDFIHNSQLERGISVAFHNKKKILSQREATDKIIKVIKNRCNSSTIQNLHIDTKNIIDTINKLYEIRKQVDNLSISHLKLIENYSDINNRFLNIIIDISNQANETNINKDLIAYTNLLFAKENIGIQRALGSYILNNEIINIEDRYVFKTLVAKENVYIDSFKHYISESTKDFFDTTMRYRDSKEIIQIENIILSLSLSDKSKIDINHWFKVISVEIDNLAIVDNYLEKIINKEIENHLNLATNSLLAYLIISIVNIVVFVLLSLAILIILKKDKELKFLIDKNIIYSATDLTGRIIKVSDAFCRISGYTRDELIGKKHNIIRHKDMSGSIFEDMWHNVKKGKQWEGRVKNLKKDGGFYWLDVKIEPIFNSFAMIESYTSIGVDVTNSVALHEEYEKNNKNEKLIQNQGKLAQMGEMISMIAHQWRQPLNAISASSIKVSLLSQMGMIKDEDIHESSTFIQNQCQTMSETIETFMNFVKPSKESKEFELIDSINDILSIISTQFKNKNIEIVVEESKENIFIDGHEDLLEQVIINILSNARDAFDEIDISDKLINITIDIKDNMPIITIEDNAGGIPNKIAEKIFNPYFTTKEQGKGTGIGLYMSLDIMKKSFNGDLVYQPINNGSRFIIICKRN